MVQWVWSHPFSGWWGPSPPLFKLHIFTINHEHSGYCKSQFKVSIYGQSLTIYHKNCWQWLLALFIVTHYIMLTFFRWPDYSNIKPLRVIITSLLSWALVLQYDIAIFMQFSRTVYTRISFPIYLLGPKFQLLEKKINQLTEVHF